MLKEAATLFNENYGIWGVHSGRSGEHADLAILIF
jgi:hypothetical protein